MTDPELRGAFRILRNGTIALKVLPFALAALYTLCLVAYLFVSDEVQTWLDMLFYISPATVLSNCVLSVIFKMCVWHKVECVMPLIPLSVVIFDIYYPLAEFVAAVNVATVFLLFLLSVINAYFVFIRKP